MVNTQLPRSTCRSEMLDFAAFRAAVCDAVVPLDIHSDCTDGFLGRLDARAVGDIHVFDIQADQHAVHRTAKLIARTPERYLKFTVVERGSGMIVQDGRESALRPGDMAVYDTDRPYSLLFDNAMLMTVVMFPKALLAVPAEPLSRLTAVRFVSTDSVGGLVRNFVSSLSGELPHLDGHITRRLHCTAVDLIGTLLEANLALAPRGHDVMLGRIHEYIADNLGDHDLNPARIARAHYISVRHLHALFEAQGTTVSTLIRARRLERSYDELANPLNATRSVSTIARGNGFVDPAHFSRTFRAFFGVSPTSLRGGPSAEADATAALLQPCTARQIRCAP